MLGKKTCLWFWPTGYKKNTCSAALGSKPHDEHVYTEYSALKMKCSSKKVCPALSYICN